MAEPAFTVHAILAPGLGLVRAGVHLVLGWLVCEFSLGAVFEPYAESLVEERYVFLGQRLAQHLGLFRLGRECRERVFPRLVLVARLERKNISTLG
jgi:hypothetical protein